MPAVRLRFEAGAAKEERMSLRGRISLLGAIALIAAACSSGGASPATSAAPSVAASDAASAPASGSASAPASEAASIDPNSLLGKIRIATDPNYKPFSFLNPDTNTYEGFDTATAEETVKRLNEKLGTNIELQ